MHNEQLINSSFPDLPTDFYEAELDFFGKHMFDVKGEKGTGEPTEGKHHFEWKPA
jgi:6-phosphogluconate dehydrogenase